MRYFLLLISYFIVVSSPCYSYQLDPEEKKWLESHSEIRIAFDNNFPPFEWKNQKGNYKGISTDYVHYIEKQLNIKFKVVETQHWLEIIQQFHEGKIDVLPAIASNVKRQKKMLFTDSHLSVQGVIISGDELSSVNELFGKKVGVVMDYYWDDIISEHDDKIDIVRVETTEDGVELTSLGAIDAMVTDLASVSYIIQKEGIGNLHVVPFPSGSKKTLDLRMGIRKDWPELRTILQKVLDDMTKEEKQSIWNKWIKLQSIAFWQSSRFQMITITIVLVLLSFFVLILLWNRSLKLEVARRSEQLQKAQTQLIHAEKMESIGRLSAGVAHEVKNPLAIMQMSIDYLKGEDNDETIRDVLKDMDDAVLRADTVIKGLLDFSREKELQVKEDNLNEVIQNSLKLIDHELKQHNIHLKSELDENLPQLPMDRNRLQQVFINLLMNAVQSIVSANNKSGEIIVASKYTDVKDPWVLNRNAVPFKSDQKIIAVQILDTGGGLKKDDEKNVFEPFFTTKPIGEGTGLGLSVSKTIINLHNGIIAMRNRIDQVESGVEVKLLFALRGK